MKKILILLVILFTVQNAPAQSYLDVQYERTSHDSWNYVKFLNTNNTYHGYDFTSYGTNSITNAVIDWSIGKMCEVTYTNDVTLVFTNDLTWVAYVLKLTGTNVVTWPINVLFTTPVKPNSNNIYLINVFDVPYVQQMSYGSVTSYVANWALYPAVTWPQIGTNRLYFADDTYLRGETTNLWFGYTE